MRRRKDPSALEIFKNALESIADGMAVTLYRTSRSSIVRNGLDFSTALLTPSAELLAQGFCLPGHLGAMPPALEGCLRHYRGNIFPQDIFVNNDPYQGGSHLPDLCLFKPLFAGEILIGYACAMAHHVDVGGRVAGSVACDSTEIYQEGLRIPPLKLYERGKANDTLFRIVENAVRIPDQVLGDIAAQVSALNYAERNLQAMLNRLELSEFMHAQQDLLQYTEELTRIRIREFPDGQWSFTDYIDDDGIDSEPIPIVTTIRKTGDGIHIDFTGTGAQRRASLHSPLATTLATVYAVAKTILGSDIPNTGGCLRPFGVTVPEGCFVNPLPPAAVGSPGIAYLRMSHALFGAFAQMLRDSVPACPGGCEFMVTFAGKDPRSGGNWIFSDVFNDEAVGGFPYQDGKDATHSPLVNATNAPAEIIETEQPVMIEEWGLLPDTEGAGKYRGGVGMVRQYRVLQDGVLAQVRSDRRKYAPFGLFGGRPGTASRIILNPGRGDGKDMPTKFIANLKKGDVLRVETPGAGGWGNPYDRDPRKVLDDVIERKITAARAREAYGVVLEEGGREIDYAVTERLRASRQSMEGKAVSNT